MENLINELTNIIKIEISASGDEPNEDLIRIKVQNVCHEFIAEKYRGRAMPDDMILSDMRLNMGSIHNVALYDYNQVGAEFQQSMSENGVNRQWISRRQLKTWLPVSKLVR